MSGGLGSQGHCEQSTSTLMLRHVTAVNRWLRLFYRLHVGKHQCRVHDRLIKRHLARGIFQIVARLLDYYTLSPWFAVESCEGQIFDRRTEDKMRYRCHEVNMKYRILVDNFTLLSQYFDDTHTCNLPRCTESVKIQLKLSCLSLLGQAG